jgi:chromosome segregation ATPase
MIEYTEKKKAETLKKVSLAIDTIKCTGDKVTRKGILEISNVSNAVLSKTYVKDLLKEEQVLMYEPKKQLQKPGTDTYRSLQRQNEQLQMQVDQLNHKLSDSKAEVFQKEQCINKIREQIEELEIDRQRLRGKVQNLLEYIKRKGLDDETIAILFKY